MEDKKPGKKERKPVPELIKSGQGRRLAQFRLRFGNKYTSREALAEEIGTSETTILEIENNLRPVTKRIEALLRNKFNKEDVDWIMNDNQEKLLTVLEEEKSSYNCRECVKKDQEIKELTSKYNRLLEEYNECLKKQAGIKKAASE